MPEINFRNLPYISILNLQLLYIIRNILRSDDRSIRENSWNFSSLKIEPDAWSYIYIDSTDVY